MLKNFFTKKAFLSDEEQLKLWEESGRTTPPPHIFKQRVIYEYRQKFNVKILIETGTYLGDMVAAQKNNFSKIYSIELSEKLHRRAMKRFAKDQHVQLLQGDSGMVLRSLVPLLTEAALYWLDGHYSGGITALGSKECPVMEELENIFTSPMRHIILIDDASLFNGQNSYPAINDLQQMIVQLNKKYDLEVKDDIIRLTPAKNQ